MYKQESEELKAALKQIQWDLDPEGDSIAQQMWTASSSQVAQIVEWTASVQNDMDNYALKSEGYMTQFLETTGTTFFDWVEQVQKFKGYIVLVD